MNFKDKLIEFKDSYPPKVVDIVLGKENSSLVFYFDTFLLETSKIMEQLWFNWRQACSKESLNMKVLNAQCMFQMMICKIESLLKLHDGIDLKINNNICHLLDPHTQFIILRSIYEMTLTFYYLYIKPRSEIEREIVYLLWYNRGMNNRQILTDVPDEYIAQQRKEKNTIANNAKRIIQLGRELGLRGKNFETLCHTANNIGTKVCCFSFEGEKDDGSLKLKINAIGDIDICKEIFGTLEISTIYRLLSLYVHPTSLGILQFGQMYNSDQYLKDENFAFETAYFLACKFTSYFLKSMPKGMDCFNALDIKKQNLIKLGLTIYPSKEGNLE